MRLRTVRVRQLFSGSPAASSPGGVPRRYRSAAQVQATGPPLPGIACSKLPLDLQRPGWRVAVAVPGGIRGDALYWSRVAVAPRERPAGGPPPREAGSGSSELEEPVADRHGDSAPLS